MEIIETFRPDNILVYIKDRPETLTVCTFAVFIHSSFTYSSVVNNMAICMRGTNFNPVVYNKITGKRHTAFFCTGQGSNLIDAYGQLWNDLKVNNNTLYCQDRAIQYVRVLSFSKDPPEWDPSNIYNCIKHLYGYPLTPTSAPLTGYDQVAACDFTKLPLQDFLILYENTAHVSETIQKITTLYDIFTNKKNE